MDEQRGEYDLTVRGAYVPPKLPPPIREFADQLANIRPLAYVIRETVQGEPQDDSPWSREAQGLDPFIQERLGFAGEIGFRWLRVTEDHFDAIASNMVFGGRFGTYGAARTAAELAYRAAWIFDPTIGPKRRVERFLAESWHGARDYVRFAPEATQRQLDLCNDEAAQYETLTGFGAHRHGDEWPMYVNRGIEADSERRPSMTDLFKDVYPGGDGALRYGFLSGFPHGLIWVLQSLIVEKPGGGKALAFDTRQWASCIQVALWPYAESIFRRATLYGWSPEPTQGLLDHVKQLAQNLGDFIAKAPDSSERR